MNCEAGSGSGSGGCGFRERGSEGARVGALAAVCVGASLTREAVWGLGGAAAGREKVERGEEGVCRCVGMSLACPCHPSGNRGNSQAKGAVLQSCVPPGGLRGSRRVGWRGSVRWREKKARRG